MPSLFSQACSSPHLPLLYIYLFIVCMTTCTCIQLHDTCAGRQLIPSTLQGSWCHAQGRWQVPSPLSISQALFHHGVYSSLGLVQLITQPQKPYIKVTAKRKILQTRPLIGELIVICLGLYGNEKLICIALSHCAFKRLLSQKLALFEVSIPYKSQVFWVNTACVLHRHAMRSRHL